MQTDLLQGEIYSAEGQYEKAEKRYTFVSLLGYALIHSHVHSFVRFSFCLPAHSLIHFFLLKPVKVKTRADTARKAKSLEKGKKEGRSNRAERSKRGAGTRLECTCLWWYVWVGGREGGSELEKERERERERERQTDRQTGRDRDTLHWEGI